MPPQTQIVDDSEDEDQPRTILNVHGDFTYLGRHPPESIDLSPFHLHVVLPDGQPKPSQDLHVSHPVTKPADVARAAAAMGHGGNGVWTGTWFKALETGTPDFMFPVRKVNSSIPHHMLERFCIRHRFVPQTASLKTMMIYTGKVKGRKSPPTAKYPRIYGYPWAFFFTHK